MKNNKSGKGEWLFAKPKGKGSPGTARCGVCGRRLTDPKSVADGVGPVCGAKGK